MTDQPTLVLKRDHTVLDVNEHYLVYFGEIYVGRIFNRTPGASASVDEPWFWGIDSGATHRLGVPTASGQSATKEAAMAAFRKAWDRIGFETKICTTPRHA